MNKLLLIWLLEVALVAFCGGNQSFHEGKVADKINSQSLEDAYAEYAWVEQVWRGKLQVEKVWAQISF